MRISHGASADWLDFVGRAQVAVGTCTHGDRLACFDAVWGCLVSVPDTQDESQRAATVEAILRIAHGMFACKHPLWSLPSEMLTSQKVALLALEEIACGFQQRTMSSAMLAKHLGICPSHLSRVWGRATKYAYSIHVNGLRTLKAALLLCSTLAPVGEIAHIVGYARTAQLDRQFQRWMHMAPSEFRAGHLSAREGVYSFRPEAGSFVTKGAQRQVGPERVDRTDPPTSDRTKWN
jgi:AraC-like DNA-binding protein